MTIVNLYDLNMQGKRVLIRQDLNVPINKNGAITNDKRIKASLPTIEMALAKGAKVIIMSHLGRPTEGKYDKQFSMQVVANRLSELLNSTVRLEKDWLNGIKLEVGEVVLCENVRFNIGEQENDDTLAKKMANLCDIFVMDAFGTAHRIQASTYGVAKYAPIACAGLLLSSELKALSSALDNPARPMVAIIGGSKVSSKLTILRSLSKIVDKLIVGGGIANTFIAAQGNNIGKSLYEKDLVITAKNLMKDCDIPIPKDVVCAKEFSESALAETKSTDAIDNDDMIFDIGVQSANELAAIIKDAGTIIWNGPVGVFEFEQFSKGTQILSMAIANSNAFSIAGGGDTLAAVYKYNIADKISYISTGGGAFLEFLGGKTLPAIEILAQRTRK